MAHIPEAWPWQDYLSEGRGALAEMPGRSWEAKLTSPLWATPHVEAHFQNNNSLLHSFLKSSFTVQPIGCSSLSSSVGSGWPIPTSDWSKSGPLLNLFVDFSAVA